MLQPNFRFVFSLFILFILAGMSQASLCVWRSPDEDIAEIYNADSYKTVFQDITDVQRQRIEQQLGYSLDPDETQFKFFPVYKGDNQIGTVMTHAGKGQFGVIEVVVAVIDTGNGAIVKRVRIQRDREKAKAALRSTKFLGQFKGLAANDNFTIDDDNGLKPAGKDAVKASKAIANAVRKLLIVYDDFYGPKHPEINENEEENK
jgi:hypothetical protein